MATENLVLQIDESFQITASVVPEDADSQDLSYKVEKEDIAKVSSDGLVTGVAEGETNITISAENGSVSKNIKVMVIKKLQEGEIVFDNSLYVNGSEISGLENKNNWVDSILNKIKTNYSIEIYNRSGEKITGNSVVGTGSVIKILNNNNLVMEYNVIMYGDANGDGKINSIDLLVIQRHILELQKLSGVFIKAGNVRKNNKNPSSVDCLLIQRHILGLQTIEQWNKNINQLWIVTRKKGWKWKEKL